LIFFSAGAGILANLSNTNFIIIAISYISPFRYCCELFLRRILAGKDENMSDAILGFMDYDYGYIKCYSILIFITILAIGVAWTALHIRSKYY
jgi:hypothetical protein